MILKENHEVVGILKEIQQIDGHLILSFQMNKDICIYPRDAVKKELEGLIDKMTAIININGEYKIREVKKNGKIHAKG